MQTKNKPRKGRTRTDRRRPSFLLPRGGLSRTAADPYNNNSEALNIFPCLSLSLYPYRAIRPGLYWTLKSVP